MAASLKPYSFPQFPKQSISTSEDEEYSDENLSQQMRDLRKLLTSQDEQIELLKQKVQHPL